MNTRNQGTGFFWYLGTAMVFFILIVILVSGVYSSPVFSGRGTENQPYRIEKEEDLLLLSRAFLHEKQQYYDAYYLLTRDLDLNQLENVMEKNGWIPIGNEEIHFNGFFDGDGKVIKNIHVLSNYAHSGLFGIIGKTGRVTNVILTEVFIEPREGSTITAGMIAGSNHGKIENVQVQGKMISKTCCVGGMVGVNEGTISDGLATVKLIVDDELGTMIGGFVGRNSSQGFIENSNMEVVIKGDQNLAGAVNQFAGKNEGKIR